MILNYNNDLDSYKFGISTYTATNVQITTKSSSGCYYGVILDNCSAESLGIADFKAMMAITISSWSQAVASFSIMYNTDGKLSVMSDVSQTVSQIIFRLLYLKNNI